MRLQWQVKDHGSRAVDGAAGVMKDFPFPAGGIYPAGNAIVAASYERNSVFNSPRNRTHFVLPLFGALAEPAVVGQVYQKARAAPGGFPRRLRKHVFKTNQWRSGNIEIFQFELHGIGARLETAADG
jgi:hypothetical protein